MWRKYLIWIVVSCLHIIGCRKEPLENVKEYIFCKTDGPFLISQCFEKACVNPAVQV